jgi:ferrochelatase
LRWFDDGVSSVARLHYGNGQSGHAPGPFQAIMTDTANPHLPPGHPPIPTAKTGLLLLNLGTPEATVLLVHAALPEGIPLRPAGDRGEPALWWVILNGIILTTRPKTSPATPMNRYGIVSRNESPLKTFTRSQAEKLAVAAGATVGRTGKLLRGLGHALRPAANVAERFRRSRTRAVTGSCCFRSIRNIPPRPRRRRWTRPTKLLTMRWQPMIRVVPPYFAHPAYRGAAIRRQPEGHMGQLTWKPDRILASFHGLPKEYLDKGDPYHCQCQKTARLLRERLGMDRGEAAGRVPVALRQGGMAAALCPAYGGGAAVTGA